MGREQWIFGVGVAYIIIIYRICDMIGYDMNKQGMTIQELLCVDIFVVLGW